VEIGSVMFGRGTSEAGPDPKPAPRLLPAAGMLASDRPPMELVRLAIPRRVYTQSHIDYVIEATIEVFQRRHELRGLRIVHEPPALRHFTAKFEEV
jgi:tryptophanase